MIGDKSVIAFDLGDKVDSSDDLYKLDIWVLDQHITINDDIAFLKSIVSYAVGDLTEGKDLTKYSSSFDGLSEVDAHLKIMSTRAPDSVNDELWINQQVLDWGPNTDDVYCFIVPIRGGFYITLSWSGSDKVYSSELRLEVFNSTIQEFVESANKNLTN